MISDVETNTKTCHSSSHAVFLPKAYVLQSGNPPAERLHFHVVTMIIIVTLEDGQSYQRRGQSYQGTHANSLGNHAAFEKGAVAAAFFYDFRLARPSKFMHF